MVGSNLSYVGRIELEIEGVWGTVEQVGWNIDDANVACRQLGYNSAVTPMWHTANIFQLEKTFFWMSNISCLGNDTSLFECRYNRSPLRSSKNDAGVLCDTGKFKGLLDIERLSNEHQGKISGWVQVHYQYFIKFVVLS